MNAAKKIRLLGYFKRFFPIWTTTLQAWVVEKAFDSDLAAAKDWNSRQEIISSRDFELSEFWGAINSLNCKKLVKRARKLHLSLEGAEWNDDQWGNRYLDDASESTLYHAIQDERRKVWDFRLKVLAVVGTLIAALTGIIGTLIGLIAILKRS
jgi:hypothetical protein